MPELKIRPGEIGGGSNAESAALPVSVPGQFNLDLSPLEDIQATRRAIEEEARGRRDAVKIVRAKAEFQRQVLEDIDGLDPLDPSHSNAVEDITRTRGQEIFDVTELETSAGQDTLTQQLAVLGEGQVTVSLSQHLEAVEGEAIQTYTESAEQALASIKQDPNGTDAYLAEFASSAALLNQGIRPETQRALADQFADKALMAQVEGLAEQGRIKDAQALLRDNEGELEPETARNGFRLIREIENRKRQDFLRDTVRTVTDLEVFIAEAGSVNDLATARDRVDDLDRQGFFQGREETRVRLIKQIEAARGSNNQQSNALTESLELFTSGPEDTLIDRSQKQVDQVHDFFLSQVPPEQAPAFTSQFIVQSGRVPSFVKRTIMAGEQTRTPEALVQAYDINNAVTTLKPNIKTGAGSRLARMDDLIEDGGMTPSQAAAFVLENEPSKEEATRRQREVAEVQRRTLKEVEVGDIAEEMGVVDDASDMGPAIENELLRRADARYPSTGNYQQAIRSAARDMGREYGPTDFGGPGVDHMRFPPERMLPPLAQQVFDPEELIEEDLRSSMGQILGRDVSDLNFWLKATPQTQRQIERGEAPEYVVMTTNDQGFPGPALVDSPTGRRPLTYRVPTMDDLRKNPKWQARMDKEAGKVVETNRLLKDLRGERDVIQDNLAPFIERLRGAED
jgi:hypothetical protein